VTTHPNARKFHGSNPTFLRACETAGTPPTNRQWRKWLQKRGAAYNAHKADGGV
jgi:hypothetical protein